MKAKIVFAMLVASVLGTSVALGQSPLPPTSGAINGNAASPGTMQGPTPSPIASITELPPGPSPYVIGDRHNACNDFGWDPEIGTELYFRPGVSFPFGGQRLSQNSTIGWIIQGGARTLFFQPDYMSAWTVDTSLSIQGNSGRSEPDTFLLDLILPNALGQGTRFNDVAVTVRDHNRTFVNVSLGKDWWLWAPASTQGENVRVGVDAGGRYGWMSMGLNEIRHRTDVIGGIFVGGHALYECCYHHHVFFVGGRTEWAYTWSDILQRQSDINELNLFLMMGVRW